MWLPTKQGDHLLHTNRRSEGFKVVNYESGNQDGEHSRCIDNGAADHVEHISMIELWVHITTTTRKRFQYADSRTMDVA